jgi:hypothetical protein
MKELFTLDVDCVGPAHDSLVDRLRRRRRRGRWRFNLVDVSGVSFSFVPTDVTSKTVED